MALTRLSDVYTPLVYSGYTSYVTPELTAFFQSGVAVTNEALMNFFAQGGVLVDLPFWNDLDSSIEPNYSTDNPADISVPQKITASTLRARIADMNQSWSDADLVKERAGSDPLQAVRDKTGLYWTRQWQRRILATCLGVMNANIANNGGDMVKNIALETTSGQSAANLINSTAVLAALYSAGDQFAIFQAIAVHSAVMQNMAAADMIQWFKPSTNEDAVPTYLGKRVIVDDGMPVIPGTTSGNKYVSIIFGEGAIGYAMGEPDVPSWMHRYEDQGNGGGVEVIGERKRMIVHPQGHKWMDATVAGLSPTDAELKLAANWNRILPRKSVPMSFLITNG